MNISKAILDSLEVLGKAKDLALLYILALYHNIDASNRFPEELRHRVNAMGLYKLVNDKLEWTVLVYEQVQEFGHFKWVVDEWLQLYKYYNMHNRDKTICVNRMKSFFKAYPHVRKDQVIKATKQYIKECIDKGTTQQYVVQPKYFIVKNRESRLYGYIEAMPENNEAKQGRKDFLYDE